MTARTDAQGQHERVIALVLEVDVDRCTNTYGVAPCTAAAGVGNECYNTYSTCQIHSAFARGTVTKKFCSRGVVVPGETVRPYISAKASVTPTEIVPSKGLAMRSQTQIQLLDEPCPDHLEDPYAATRATPAQGSFWTRLLARNRNLVGRPVRVRQGYVSSPWSWASFQTQLFIIDGVRGPDNNGGVTLVLSDVLKIADNNMVPQPTDGALTANLAAIENQGAAQGGGASSITLATAAQPVDSYYNTMGVYISAGTGAGQRRTISGYVGASRVATVSTAWAVVPDGTSQYQVSALMINVGAGKGAKYPNPATSGKNEYIRIGDEVVRFTAISGDVLSWPDATYRAQWGTTLADHQTDDAVQLCRAWLSKRPWEVLRDLFTESGISSTYLDLTGWQSEDTNWFNGADITAIVTQPEKAADLASEFLRDMGAVAWWSPVEQLVRMLANQPGLTGTVTPLTDDNFVLESTKVQAQDNDRITQAAMYYGMRNYTANKSEAKNFLGAAINIDIDAQGASEYGDTRPDTRYSRWLSTPNKNYARAVVARRVSRLRNAPMKVEFKLDPKDEVQLGTLVQVSTRRLVDATGKPAATTCRVVRSKDAGTHFEVLALSANYAKSRYGVISPTGMPDYGSATDAQRVYAFISNTATSKMTNGDSGYYIF